MKIPVPVTDKSIKIFVLIISAVVVFGGLFCGPKVKHSKSHEIQHIAHSIFLGEKKLWYAILDELKKNPNRKLDEIIATIKKNDPDLVICPVSGLPFAINPNLDLWLANEQHDEIAIISQFKIDNLDSTFVFQGIKFDLSGEKLDHLPNWAKMNPLD